MKLPSAPKLGVQSLGREDVGAPARQFNAEHLATNSISNTIKGGLSFVSGVANNMYDASQKQDAESAGRNIKRDLDIAHMRAGTQENYDLNNEADSEFLKQSEYKDKDSRSSVERHEVISQAWEYNRDRIVADGLEGLSDKQRAVALKDIDIDGLNLSNQKQSINVKSKAIKAKGLSDANQLVDDGNLTDAIRLVADAPYYTDETQDKLIGELREKHENNIIEKTQFSGDINAIKLLSQTISSEDYQGTLTKSQREATIKDLDGAVVELTADAVAAKEKERALFASNLEVGVSRGQYGMRDIDSAFRNDKITGAKRTQLIKMKDAQLKAKALAAANSSFIADVANGKQAFNPLNSAHRKAVNKELKGVTDPATLEQAAHSFNFIPKTLKDIIESDAMIGDGVQAVDIFSRMQDTNPYMLKDIDPTAREILMAAAAYSRGGTQSKEAVELVKAIGIIPKEIQDSRKETYSKGKDALKLGNKEALEEAMDADEGNFDLGGGWNSDVVLTPDMLAEYNTMVEANYVRYDDIGVARNMAYMATVQNWGITEVGSSISGGELAVNDKRASRNSPERLLNSSPAHINKALGIFADEYSIENPIIMPNANTVRGKAQWNVFDWDEETQTPTIAIDERGFPLVWNAEKYMDTARDAINIDAVNDALVDEGLLDEEGNITQQSREGDLLVMSSQLGIDERIDKAKTTEDKLAVAKDVLTDNNASPEQIRAATEFIDKGAPDAFRALRRSAKAPSMSEDEAVAELWN